MNDETKRAKRARADTPRSRRLDSCAAGRHDYPNAVKMARATWLCPNCKKDISLSYIYWAEAAQLSSKISDRAITLFAESLCSAISL